METLELRKDTRSKRNKRPNTKHNFRSGFEEKTATFLDEHGIKYGYETDKIPFLQPEMKRNYIPDFVMTGWYLECKGRFLAADRKKMLMVKEQNPKILVRILLQRDIPIRKGSKTLLSTWCAKHGFDYAVSPTGAVPARWITG